MRLLVVVKLGIICLLLMIASQDLHSAVVNRGVSKLDVAGVIQVTRIVQPNENLLLNGALEDEIAPDERHFFIVTRRHDLAQNKNVYKLLLFDATHLDRVLEKRRTLAPRVLVEASSSSNFVFEGAIRSAKWVDASTIAFLGEFGDRATQLFTVDVQTGKIQQLTRHDSPVLAYVYSPTLHTVVYVARVPVDNSYMHGTSFVAGNSSLTQLLFPDYLPVQPLVYRYYRAFTNDAAAYQPLGEPFTMGRMPPLMSLSSNGQWVITRVTPSSIAETLRLAGPYKPVNDVLQPYLAQDEDPESLFTEQSSSLLMQMRIFDVRSGERMPWFDVPDGTSLGREWPFAHWMPRGDSVVIANTYLPLEEVSDDERKIRMETPSVIEYWPRTGHFRKIVDLTSGGRNFEGLYTNAAMPFTVFVKDSGRYAAFRQHADGWVRDDTLVSGLDHSGKLRGRLELVQSVNEPPEVAFRAAGGMRVRVTDLNPQLRQVDIGRAVGYVWTDRSGRTWRGGLLLPSDFSKQHRYPLVVQLHGYADDKFYIDGARHIASAMAGRAYLSEDILVLAVPTDYMKGAQSRDTLFVNAEGVRAAVEQLSAEGIVDKNRVGLVGFSGTGIVAQHIITFADVRIRAVTLADSGQNSLFSAVAYMFGFYKPGMLLLERSMGAKPWGDTAMLWAQRDPSLHTDCIEAAVRYEFNGREPQQGWDSYALLRRQYKPVEAIFFPEGAHQLRRPKERFDSLQGNLDWFRFWLKNEEDPDPAKAAQYERWRRMAARSPLALRRESCVQSE